MRSLCLPTFPGDGLEEDVGGGGAILRAVIVLVVCLLYFLGCGWDVLFGNE